MDKKRKEKLIVSVLLLTTLCLVPARTVFSHCEIPCGIYDDRMRISMIAEDITTLEKSMKLIVTLSTQKEENFNQIVRWIQNKEDHANKIAHGITQYFMTQRLKPAGQEGSEEHRDYLVKLTLLHEMLIYAMKAKQTTDLANVEKLRTLLDKFEKVYFGDQEKGHAHGGTFPAG